MAKKKANRVRKPVAKEVKKETVIKEDVTEAAGDRSVEISFNEGLDLIDEVLDKEKELIENACKNCKWALKQGYSVYCRYYPKQELILDLNSFCSKFEGV